jgi:hypothetical protein
VLVDRVDVVTGGASAAYGSGAISGVNNVMLNRKLEGGRAEIDFGQTAESDGRDRHIGLAYGTGLFNDRGHVILGYEYQKSDAVGCYDARDWCREGNGFIGTAGGLRWWATLATTRSAGAVCSTTARLRRRRCRPTRPERHDGLQQGPGYETTSAFSDVSGGDGESISPVHEPAGSGRAATSSPARSCSMSPTRRT